MVKKKVRNQTQTQKRSKWDKYLFLDWKEFYLILIAWFLFIVLHNILAIIFRIDENVLPFIAFKIIPIFTAIAFVYTLGKVLKKRGN